MDPFGPEVSAVYDLFYRNRGKDFAAEAEAVAEVVTARARDANALLDVACGTGEHLRALRGSFARVEGVEVSPDMLAIARSKLPGVPVHRADMRDFELGRRFDAVCCLFSSVGYLATVRDLDAAIARMAAHLRPGGVLVVDPWWFPDRFLDGFTSESTVNEGEQEVRRRSRSTRVGDVVRHEAHYAVADPTGTRSFAAIQWITLFTRTEYISAFARAGCAVEHLEGFMSQRGLFVGIRA
ncbi:class I SAM-dependent methyltransferase [Saccharopolyspora sp. CA-218241]|uniref:class I SAM-dependent methyltransferase n=1 Tax=Saccharopolyspora sp. CA-218241 TaxID=3240027 RepID=UPI003D994C26